MGRIRIRRPPPNTYHLLLNLTNRHIHAQLVDKTAGTVVLSTHTTEPTVRHAISGDAPKGSYVTASVQAAKYVGQVFAKKAADSGVNAVYWNRPGKYHGKIKAFIDEVRAAGVQTITPPRNEMPDAPAVDN